MRRAFVSLVAGGMVAGLFASLQPADAQTARGRQIEYDASGRQVEDARDRPARAPKYVAPPLKFGRAPLQTGPGSFGLHTGTAIKPDKFPDGGQIPGVEAYRRQNQMPFMGFSLSVPTN